ncbi:hypothetical protein EMCRGX_G010916 [Ephydatia muelleri]
MYSPSLSRLWRSGPCILHYEAKEDDQDFNVHDSAFDMQEEEYALSKDIDVALWIDYRTFYGECPLKELLGGNSVIINEHLQDEFEEFRGKIQCAIGTTHILVKGIELLKL